MNLEAQWIVGFVDGEGCFHVGISSHLEMTRKVQILPEFTVVQHKDDVQVLNALKKYFGCGVVRVNHGDRLSWRVRKMEHLSEVIIPFFEKHKLKSRKRQDFEKFRDVVRIMKDKVHLTDEGEKRVKRIASMMNRGRRR